MPGMYQRLKPPDKDRAIGPQKAFRAITAITAITQIIPVAPLVPNVSILTIVILLLFIGNTVMPARADQVLDPQADSAQEVLNVEADRFSLDFEKNETTALGNVTLYYRDMQLNADQVRYKKNDRQAWAIGNVKLISGNDILSGDRMELDLGSETGILENGFVFLDENHLYIRGDEIRKTGPDTYTASRATITPCDSLEPDWWISGKDVKVTIEGYGFARHAAFWAKQVPLLYTPYLVFPAKTKRQSGLLIPELDYSATRKGFQYLQPVFWAINNSSDATFYAEYISLRGLRLGTEYRYALAPETNGTIIMDGFNDRQVDDGTGDSSKTWGYPDDAFLRPNSDRYWLRAKADQPLPGDIHAKLDLDWVSDQDYLHEFKSGGLGFDNSQRYFRETYGRDLEDDLNNLRLNQLNLNRTWHRFSANGDLRWYDDVVQRRQEEIQDTVQNLPALSLDAVTQQVGILPVFYAFDTRYDHFFRLDGDRGHRADFYARLSYPTHLLGVLSVVPAAGMRQTFWHMDHREIDSDLENDQFQRSLYDLKLNIFSDLFRIYEASSNPQSSLKHIIRPEIDYAFIPQNDQTDLPQFDTLDRIEARNKVTYSLTNTLIKRPIGASPPQQQSLGGKYEIRFKIQQSFDIDKYNDDNPRPFSDVLGELDIVPGYWLRINTEALWSPYDNAINKLTAGGHLKNARGDQLDINYRFLRTTNEDPDTQSLLLRGAWQVADHWQLRGMHEHNLATDEAIETGLGFSYQPQCWALDVDYTEEADDRSISVNIRLLGL